MTTINYKITFYSEWHCGSGLAAGADVDLLVVKDPHGLPFVPGKTMKGLIREAVEDYLSFSGTESGERTNVSKTDVSKLFGTAYDAESGTEGQAAGTLFFSNASLPQNESEAIVGSNTQKYLYRKVASTAIDDNGQARDHSLRKMQTVVPCTLEGKISGEMTDDEKEVITKSLGLIKRLGQNRNRGLGRCSVCVCKTAKTNE